MTVAEGSDLRFAGRDVTLAAWVKALAHPARLRILRLLAARRGCICGDIVDELPLAQSTVSQHLAELKRTGLIKGEIEGPRVCYCLDHDVIGQLRSALSELIEELDRKPTDCC